MESQLILNVNEVNDDVHNYRLTIILHISTGHFLADVQVATDDQIIEEEYLQPQQDLNDYNQCISMFEVFKTRCIGTVPVGRVDIVILTPDLVVRVEQATGDQFEKRFCKHSIATLESWFTVSDRQ
ncbi:MAG: hypothetical protein EZS28_027724 [Streblomastix strix]|uniref:Uncharacterized protein n=1 Tax=Streblomastix strix TaxID=222440 RepID=A0A5J4V3X5_9EUKA|nr:MAG: hypothetical protein EZS28_027724 [Streblomastix strix]